jgi:cupin fold WbuC family metalloprotein
MPVNRNQRNHPTSMEPPSQAVIPIASGLIERAIAASRESPRGRIILPLHKASDDPLQRMLNALQPGSYIRPHRHANPSRAETIVVLAGSIGYIAFDDCGEVAECYILKVHSLQMGVDTEGGTYHTFFALEPDTVLFEVKPGPYSAVADKEFAPWAPPEYSEDAQKYLEELSQRLRIPKEVVEET